MRLYCLYQFCVGDGGPFRQEGSMNPFRCAGEVNRPCLILVIRGCYRLMSAFRFGHVLFAILPLQDRSDAFCQGGLLCWWWHDQNRSVRPVGLRWPLSNL